ncbi:MAG: D-alanyl-D-alanine carboxypeptidase family protein [Clostridia bacterium]
MHQSPMRTRRIFSFILAMMLVCVLWLSAICVPRPLSYLPTAAAETVPEEEVRFVPPKLPADAPPYDPEKPEDLQSEQLYAKSAILIEASTGSVIFEKNADDVMFPASTTKIMTVLLGIMMGDMTQKVVMTESAAYVESGSATIPLDVGEDINFKDLLYATMVRSGNDGANLIAETIGGDIPTFVEQMNKAAQMYGCTSTNFVNPHGLHDDNHYTTARDMAKIAKAAMENEMFRDIVKTYNYSLPGSNLRRARVLLGTSEQFLNPNITDNEFYYPYGIGIKTGNTARAGQCFVGAAEKDGVELISVVFYTTQNGRWTDTKKLMEYGFTQFVSMTPQQMYNQNPILVETSGFSLEDKNMGRLELEIKPTEGARTVQIVATKAEMEAMARNIKQTALIEYTRDFTAPIEKGEVMGILTYYPADGGSAVVYNLIAQRTILRRENAPKSIEEIEAEVYADPNPLPPLTVELAFLILLPLVVLFLLIRLLLHFLRKTGRHKKGRVPKPRNRYFR